MANDNHDSYNYAYPTDEDYNNLVWQHEAAIHRPMNWLWSSECNEAAFNVLEERVNNYWGSHGSNQDGWNMIGPYYMLVGFAIECLLKGIIVANGHRVMKNGKIKFVDGKNQHDLIKLADKAKIVRDEDEDKILEVLAENLEWSGRYPMAQHWSKQFKKTESSEHCAAKIEDITLPYNNIDIHIIRRLHSKIKGILKSKLPNCEVKLVTVI